ncbi:polysaccharide deacetylase family protein [Alteromonas oceanisediminis]|uniref:polysaccharide deacetylase family protein n=1 Tax=Alteromonas oceanisediminis TaxID=2836180 RepID=UPI001BDA340E|nr:polysaccharide deacetylase family protein [Alteromonas oceanisediminis]MBT0587881.1 polysaccharide deacetylase family protein [Alteromonas oceanisediminis]
MLKSLTVCATVLFQTMATLLSLLGAASAAAVENHATIMLYHHVSADTPASTSVTQEQFASHLDYIAEHYTVLPLTEIVTAIQDGTALPDRALAITFDDGYQNILDNAHPLLAERDMPYTIFVNPALVGVQASHLDWADIKRMAKEGVLFANHTQHHHHLLTRNGNESDSQWLARTLDDIESAEAMLSEKLGYSLKYVAYPYGEFNLALADALRQRGYVGFGQHSGAVATGSELGALPRFPAAGIYANLNTLKTKMASKALPLQSELHEPAQMLGSQPSVSLVLSDNSVNPSSVTCFHNSETLALKLEGNTVEFRMPAPLKAGRTRVNCTAPSGEKGRFYWYSQPFFVARKDGSYPD